MTDELMFTDEDRILHAPKLRVNHHGWVEQYDGDGSIVGLIPPHRVKELNVGIERFREGFDD